MGFSGKELKWQKWMCLFSILTGTVPKSVVNGDPAHGYPFKNKREEIEKAYFVIGADRASAPRGLSCRRVTFSGLYSGHGQRVTARTRG